MNENPQIPILGRWKRYPSYKQSGVEWLGEIPDGWKTMPLKRIVKVKITDGPHETPELIDNGIPFISAEAIKNNKINFSLRRGYISTELHELYKKKVSPQKNDIFIVKSGATTGAVAKVEVDFEFDIWSPLAMIRADENKIKANYLFSFVQSIDFKKQVELSWSFGTQQNIGMNVIEKLICTIPSLDEQSSISTFLNRETTRIDALIEKKEHLISLIEEKRAALISHTATKGLDPDARMKDSGVEWIGVVPEEWKVLKIKRLCLVKRGASPRPIDDTKYFDDNGEYAWVRISDVTASNKYLYTTEQKLSDLGKSFSVPIEPGEIFLSMAGTIGKPIITKIKCCIHDGFVYFCGCNQNREFLYYLFLCGEMYKGLGKLGTQLNLNTDTIGDIKIPIPDAKEQTKIVTYLNQETDKNDNLIESIKNSIKYLQEYRSTLISATVTGKIDVRHEAAV